MGNKQGYQKSRKSDFNGGESWQPVEGRENQTVANRHVSYNALQSADSTQNEGLSAPRAHSAYFPPKQTGSAFWGLAGSSVRLVSFVSKTGGSAKFKSYSQSRSSYRGGSTRSKRSIRLFSQQSRREWADKTLKDKNQASRTAWPVSQIEGLFLPDFPVKPEINEDNFEVLEHIACGSYGNVLKVRFMEDKEIYAMKILKKTQIIAERAVRQCKDEVQIQSFYGDHPFIVKAHYFWQAKQSLYIVMDYVPCGELLALWRRHGGFPEEVVKVYIAELAMVLDFLHLEGVIYRDLKMENILLDKDGHLQLTDFGLAKWLPSGERARTICGTLQYMAPEVLYGQEYDHTADWWTLGILMYALLMGEFPISGPRDHREMGAAVARYQYELPQNFKTDVKQLINKLLNKKPTKRLSNIMDLQRLQYFNNLNFDTVFDKHVCPRKHFKADIFELAARGSSRRSITDLQHQTSSNSSPKTPQQPTQHEQKTPPIYSNIPSPHDTTAQNHISPHNSEQHNSHVTPRANLRASYANLVTPQTNHVPFHTSHMTSQSNHGTPHGNNRTSQANLVTPQTNAASRANNTSQTNHVTSHTNHISQTSHMTFRGNNRTSQTNLATSPHNIYTTPSPRSNGVLPRNRSATSPISTEDVTVSQGSRKPNVEPSAWTQTPMYKRTVSTPQLFESSTSNKFDDSSNEYQNVPAYTPRAAVRQLPRTVVRPSPPQASSRTTAPQVGMRSSATPMTSQPSSQIGLRTPALQGGTRPPAPQATGTPRQTNIRSNANYLPRMSPNVGYAPTIPPNDYSENRRSYERSPRNSSSSGTPSNYNPPPANRTQQRNPNHASTDELSDFAWTHPLFYSNEGTTV